MSAASKKNSWSSSRRAVRAFCNQSRTKRLWTTRSRARSRKRSKNSSSDSPRRKRKPSRPRSNDSQLATAIYANTSRFSAPHPVCEEQPADHARDEVRRGGAIASRSGSCFGGAAVCARVGAVAALGDVAHSGYFESVDGAARREEYSRDRHDGRARPGGRVQRKHSAQGQRILPRK